jgi:hypothetical protein
MKTTASAFAPRQTTQAVDKAPAAKVQPLPSMPRGRGRPRKEIVCQTTTVRMPTETHFKVRGLALREHLSMSDLIVKALQEYAEKRGLAIA